MPSLLKRQMATNFSRHRFFESRQFKINSDALPSTSQYTLKL